MLCAVACAVESPTLPAMTTVRSPPPRLKAAVPRLSFAKNRYVLRGFTVDPRQGGNVTNRFQETTSAHRFAVFASSGRHIQRHPFGRKNTSRCVSLVAMASQATGLTLAAVRR